MPIRCHARRLNFPINAFTRRADYSSAKANNKGGIVWRRYVRGLATAAQQRWTDCPAKGCMLASDALAVSIIGIAQQTYFPANALAGVLEIFFAFAIALRICARIMATDAFALSVIRFASLVASARILSASRFAFAT